MSVNRDLQCPHCQKTTSFYFSTYCGAWCCTECDHHRGLCRCFCGWAEDGGDGRRQLEELGEVIDGE